MPFTPFHMGVALVAKPAARRHFSLLAFSLAQVAMDVEPLVGMLRDQDVLHGRSHTVVGALLIGMAVAMLAPFVLRPVVAFLHRKAKENRLEWILDPQAPSRGAVWAGSLVGTLSHVVLDALIHHDMRPLAPFSQATPLLGLVEHDSVYRLCAWMAAAGAAVWVISRWQTRKRA
ncbi:DUF4184 family protein [Variovorax sp. J22R115]|uniref:DUF4184 family protein n=1 Tax=Variovorax sp. J22R115 TaxID=3053509 RepID=UPI002577B8D8|nr:DUF4184 family protein [Variovorax sp. J22R115]MDM0053840.1 DUF4184 family protein [Variovorax sp. J22R115]